MTSEGWYVYAVIRDTDPSPIGLPGIFDDGGTTTVAGGDLAVIASEVDASRFETPSLEELLSDRAALEAAVRSHQDVCDSVAATSDLLPLRFGTVYRSRDAITAFLLRHEQRLWDAFEAVSGCREWGVQLLWNTERSDTVAISPDAASGRAFLESKARRVNRRDDEAALASARAADIHERLLTASRNATLLAPHPVALTGESRRMVLNGAYLVRRDDEAAFAQLAESIAAEGAASGHSCILNGPWPPHSFIDLDLEPADVADA